MKPLSIPALAKLADLTPARMWQLQKEGKIPFRNVGKGKQARYDDSEELRDWILELKVRSGRGWRERRMGEKRVRHISLLRTLKKAGEIINSPEFDYGTNAEDTEIGLALFSLLGACLEKSSIGPCSAFALATISQLSKPNWKQSGFVVGPNSPELRAAVLKAVQLNRAVLHRAHEANVAGTQ